MADEKKATSKVALEVLLSKDFDHKHTLVTRTKGAVIGTEDIDGASYDDVEFAIKEKLEQLSKENNVEKSRIPIFVDGDKAGEQLIETLQKRGLRSINKSKAKSRKDKDYYYDDYGYYYDPITPWGVINFDELDQAEAAKELNYDYLLLFAQYAEMGKRIIDGDYYLEFGDERGKLSLMTELTQQFLNRLESVTAEKGSVRKELKEKVAEEVVNQVVEETAQAATEQLEEQPAELVAQNQGVALYKNAKGEMIWAGVHSNKFMDRDGDILTEASHKRFVEKVYNGDYDFPELWIWHTPVAVGKTEWMAYDERGFLLSGGKVFKEYEGLVTSLVENTPEMGMSHGMPEDTVVYDDENFIKEYQSIEVTMLPVENASNILTEFKVGKK